MGFLQQESCRLKAFSQEFELFVPHIITVYIKLDQSTHDGTEAGELSGAEVGAVSVNMASDASLSGASSSGFRFNVGVAVVGFIGLRRALKIERFNRCGFAGPGFLNRGLLGGECVV